MNNARCEVQSNEMAVETEKRIESRESEGLT